MRNLLSIFFIAFSLSAFGQTWADDVADIFYEKCATCHNPNGIAPFSLVSYSEVSPMAGAIYDAVNQKRMPPWPPNNDYQQYVHNRALEGTQKTTILNWLTAGAPEGNPANTPPPPAFPVNAILGSGDLELQIPTYMSKAQAGNDDYVCFSLPTGLTTNRTIKYVEVIPGNRGIVHHALVYIDPDGTSVTDTTGGDCASPSSQNSVLVTGYTPGSSPLTLPTVSPMKLGIPLPANSKIIMAMHYPDGSYGEFDSTRVIFHFYPPGETGIRQVYAAPLISNWTFLLPPNQVTQVSAQYPNTGTINTAATVLSVFPHMHLVEQKIKVWGLDPSNDSIPLMDIPHWDFHWQDFYFFKNAKRFDVGSKIQATGFYDNTTANPHNPNNPPAWVWPGENTSDEMFLVYFHFMGYQAGDELHDIEELMALGLKDLPKDNSSIHVYPNPSSGEFKLELTDQKNAKDFSIRIYDTQGKVIRSWKEVPSANEWVWDGKQEDGAECRKGVYILSANIDGQFYSTRLIRF